ncbi:MAG: DUF2905 domain-containing protein, partial [Nitrospinaceae bacterium]|nr:DUF2905 domain-containing protein [Nitrospinaceae bacterium]
MTPGDPFSGFGKTLLTLGLIIAAVGVALIIFPKIPWLGRLPGDIHLRGKNWRFHFPLATSVI